ncbi:MAG: hypothetical protein JOZ41_03900 [Chloroflexi bacterium]|nr:hypothetical protein [Chloroflexota bacterium]
MPTRTGRSDQDQAQSQADDQDDQSEAQAQEQPRAQSQGQGQDQAQDQVSPGSSRQESDGASAQPEADSKAAPGEPHYYYDPAAAVRAELIRLGDDWRAAGALYQAIAAYTEVLTRYPDSGAAAAATEGLVTIAREMKQHGRYYAALGIFKKLEALV